MSIIPSLAAFLRGDCRIEVVRISGIQLVRVFGTRISKAREAPVYAVCAADLLLRDAMEEGVTSPDVLYLAAAFAWPLRDLAPDRSREAWAYLASAPWQTDASVMTDLCKIVDESGAMDHDRRLIDLAAARIEVGRADSARELLEAVACVQANVDRIEAVTEANLATKCSINNAEDAIVWLARQYIAIGETRVHAREVLGRAVTISERSDKTPSSELRTALDNTVWDRPFVEAYDWSKGQGANSIDEEIARVLSATPSQADHARRLAEALLVRNYEDPLVGKPDASDVPIALKKFVDRWPEVLENDFASRRAAEHLALLYSRTNYSTKHARRFVSDVAEAVLFTGAGAALNPCKDELERFATADPYNLLTQEEHRIRDARGAFRPDELRLADDVSDWFARRHAASQGGAIDTVISFVTLPLSEAASALGRLVPGVEHACEAAFRAAMRSGIALAGDLSELRRSGDAQRESQGLTRALVDRARDLTRPARVVATAAAGGITLATSLVPVPGLSVLASGIDLGVTLLASFQVVARIGALFGREIDPRTPAGMRFIADSFALGCSSKNQEGLAAYLTRGKQRVVTSFTLGSVAYGGMMLSGYLWTNSQDSRVLVEQSIRHLARICGLGLSQSAVTKLLPVGGAIISAASTWAFIESIIDAAIHLAAREAILERVDRTA